MFLCPRLCSLGAPLGPWVGGGGAPDAGSGPSPREFPHGGADACTPRQGVTLLYGPSICTRSVQMDLRRNQVRRPFPTPGSGTLWVSGESLRVRHVSCLPRWTVCPTRSPSQDTNRSTCRGECSWSGPLATPPGRCHLGPLAIGPGRNPPYCSRSDGADTDTGGAPKPQRSGTSPASFAGPCHPAPPRWSLLPCIHPQGPWPLAVPPGSRPVPSAPAACPCPGMLVSSVARFVFFFFFFFSRRPRPFCGWASELEAGGGGGALAVLPFAQAGGGPPLASVIPLVPSPSPRCPRLCPWWVREVGARGGGAPSLPFLRRKHVAGTALARGTALVLLLGCEARRVAPAFALSTLRALPRCPPRWCGGAAARPSPPATPTLGGAEACGGGGGLVVFLPLPSRRWHEAWFSSLCRGGWG